MKLNTMGRMVTLADDNKSWPLNNISTNNFSLNSTSLNNSGPPAWILNLRDIELDPPKLIRGNMEVFLICLYSLVCLMGLFTNLSLIWVILGKKVHRTPKNLYILNLGISGLSTSVICLPPTLAQCLYGGKWFLGLAACKLVPTMQGTNVLVAAGTITAIAIDRWWSITQTSGQANQLTMRKVAAVNFFIWLISFLICSPILVFQDLQVNPYPNCMEFWPHPQMKNAFTILILAFLERNSGLAIDARRQERERKRNKRMTFVLSCIAITFAVSFLPLHLFFTVTDLGLWGITAQNIKMYYFILGVCHCVAFSSCVSNPVLYGWLNTNLRKEFLKALPGWMVPAEDCSTTTTQLIKGEAST